MRQPPEVIKAKEQWVEEYYRKYPDHSADTCNEALRKKFSHGLKWTTVQNIRLKTTGHKVKGRLKVERSATIIPPSTAQPTAAGTDQTVAFRQALTAFRNQIKALSGVTLRTLSIKLDENTGKWDIEYDLVNKETQVAL